MNPRSCRGLALLSLVLAISPSARSQELPKPDLNEPTIRVNVTRVNVGVTVADSQGRFVKGLRPEDFRVMDNGQEQAIISFTSTEEPARLVFLIESGIQNYFLAKFGMSSFAAADALLANISPSDQVAIVTYSNQARVVLNFTLEKAQVRHTLRALHSQLLTSRTGSTTLNLSSSVAATLNWLAQVPGRKTIVLLSTGFDTSPRGTWQTVHQMLATSEVRLLAVSLFGDFRKLGKGQRLSRDEKEERKFVRQTIADADRWLRQLSAATGGRAYVPKTMRDFQRAYAEIGQLVRGEYTLEFAPPLLDGQMHSIRVHVRRSRYRLMHRQAYLATPPPADSLSGLRQGCH